MNYINKSYLFIPFSSPRSLKKISEDIEKSTVWESLEDNFGTRYMLKYVAQRINNSVDDQTICIQKRLSSTSQAAKEYFGKKYFAFYKDPDYHKTLGFKFGDVFLFCFDTGLNFIAVELNFNETDCFEISRSLFTIKNINKKNILEEKAGQLLNGQTEENASFSILEMAEKIKNESDALSDFSFFEQTSHKSFQKANVLSYVESDEKTDEELDRMLFYLSHCYNDGFDYSEDTGDTFEKYKNNSVCTWGITSEAIACVAFPKENGFVENVFRSSLTKGYLLMYVLILNQKYKLYDFLTETAKCFKDRKTDEMKKYRNDFYTFEQNYNFRIIAETPQYQNVYHLIYKINSIDLLMKDVKEPLDAINSIIAEEDSEREAENSKKTEKALTLLSLFSILSALIDGWAFVSAVKPFFFGEQTPHGSWGQLILSAVLLVIYVVLIVILFSVRSESKKKKEKKE